ncbi:hypothetical protein ACN28I_41070 [Archangium gephyra]|uniref:hypothetical protein n=1 Tax=Archangium gephyra TaxID=48 RepID=UPI003B824F27
MWREIRPRWLALLGLALVVSACGGDEEEPDGLLIDPAHQTVAIAPGGRVPVHVKLDRTGSLSGAILVTGSAGPSGLTAEPLVLTAEESEGDLHLQVTETAEIGARGRVLVLAQSGNEAYSATVDVEVIAPVTVQVQSGSPLVTRGQSAQVRVAIERTGGFAGPVRLAVQGPPAGISVDTQELTLEAGTASATFTFRTTYATPVAKHPLTFTAATSRFSASTTTFLEVTRPAGLWDEGFGTAGSLTLPDNHNISSLVTQPDGRIVLGTGNYGMNVWIHRLELDGRPDTTFGQAGVVELPFPAGVTYVSQPKLVLQPDGKLLVLTTSSGRGLLYRFKPDGSLDTPFGSGGLATVDLHGYFAELLLLPDGALLVTSRSEIYVESLRLSSLGLKDESYGSSGRVLLRADDLLSNAILGAFVDAQGRAVIAVGYRASDASMGGVRVFRVTREGVADTTFGPDGQRTYPLSPDFRPNAFSQLEEGLVVLGSVTKDTTKPGEQWLVRLGEQAGTLEYRWKSMGMAWTNADGALTTLSDGSILAMMSTGPVRTLSTGVVDTRFQAPSVYAWELFTGPGDVVYVTAGQNIRRLLPPY